MPAVRFNVLARLLTREAVWRRVSVSDGITCYRSIEQNGAVCGATARNWGPGAGLWEGSSVVLRCFIPKHKRLSFPHDFSLFRITIPMCPPSLWSHNHGYLVELGYHGPFI